MASKILPDRFKKIGDQMLYVSPWNKAQSSVALVRTVVEYGVRAAI